MSVPHTSTMAHKRDAPPATSRRSGALLDQQAGERQAWFRVASMEVDRDGTIVDPAGIDLTYHRQNPIFLWQHQSGTNEIGEAPPPDVVIGRVVQWDQAADHLDVLVEFDDDGPGGLASRCWAKVRAGLIRMVSLAIGVRQQETRTIGGKDVVVYTRSELWEISLVIIGSLRSALRQDRGARTSHRRPGSAQRTAQRGISMNKQELCKALGIEETADRGAAEDASYDYMTSTGDDPEKRKAVRAALDEHFPEASGGAAGGGEGGEAADKGAKEPGEGGEGGEGGEPDDIEAVKEALAETQKALKAAQAQLAGADGEKALAVKREAKLVQDVEQWVKDGRVKEAEKAGWLDKHRAGKAWRTVKHIARGTHTSGQRLHGGGVGTPVEFPEAPMTEVKREAQAHIAKARAHGRPVTDEPAAPQSDAQSIVARARATKVRG